MLKLLNTSAYLELGSELFFFGVTQDAYELGRDTGAFTDKTRVNIFLTEANTEVVQYLAVLITKLYQEVFSGDSSKINLYYPSQKICEYLQLQQVSTQWYNFFINLWDEIIVDGLEKPAEYMFIQENIQEREQYSNKITSVELIVPKQLSMLYGTREFGQVMERGTAYDLICYTIREEKDYDNIVRLTEGKSEIRNRIYLILCNDDVKEERTIQDGFCAFTKEE